MSESKSKTKSVKAGKPAESRFVAMATKAMRKAQHTAARENARFGLPLIVTRLVRRAKHLGRHGAQSSSPVALT